MIAESGNRFSKKSVRMAILRDVFLI